MLIGSLFIYKMTALPSIPTNIVHKFNGIITDFIWSGRRPKISLRILQANKKCGGAQLIKLEARDMAIKVTWLNIIKSDPELANLAYNSLSRELGENIWRTNIQAKDICAIFQKSFWTDVLEAWSNYNYESDIKDPTVQIIWCNSHIRMENNVILWKNCISKGLLYVHQPYRNGTTISAKEAITTYGLTMMQFNGLISSIPQQWKMQCKNTQNVAETSHAYDKMVNNKNISQIKYESFTSDMTLMARKHKSWCQELNMDIPYKEYIQGLIDIKHVTNITKLRSFQYRILQRSLVTNVDLHRWGITTNFVVFAIVKKKLSFTCSSHVPKLQTCGLQ